MKVKEFYEIHPYPRIPLEKKRDLRRGAHAKTMRNILSTIPLRAEDLKGKRVLDAGCGTGEKALYFALHGAKTDALDISKTSVAEAKKTAKKLGLRVNFFEGDIFDFEKSNYYDHVFCIGVLHHTKNPAEGFRRLAGCVKKGGTLTVGLYNAYGKLYQRAIRFLMKLRWGRMFLFAMQTRTARRSSLTNGLPR